ncbi:MAG: DUF4190 domain-containing protein [Lachnospiraceae bacterium]|nr:DUF4190 domain-containing protein [Lachnospiraceae bacterium]
MEEKKSSTLPMIFGIVSIVLSCTFGIGLIFAIISLILSKKAEPDGKRKAGIITSIIGMVLSVIALIVIIIMAAITAAGASAVKGVYDDLSENTSGYDWNISTEDDWNIDSDDWDFGNLTELDLDLTNTSTSEESVSDTTEAVVQIPDPASDTDDSMQSDSTFDWKRVGGMVGGYLDIPDTYYNFYETGGYSDVLIFSEQYAYGMSDIITHFTYPQEYDAKMTAQNLYDGLKADSQVTSVNMELYDTGSYQGYFVDSVYSDGIECRIFIFDDEDQNMQYISVEGITTDEYSGIWKNVFDSYQLAQ